MSTPEERLRRVDAGETLRQVYGGTISENLLSVRRDYAATKKCCGNCEHFAGGLCLFDPDQTMPSWWGVYRHPVSQDSGADCRCFLRREAGPPGTVTTLRVKGVAIVNEM